MACGTCGGGRSFSPRQGTKRPRMATPVSTQQRSVSPGQSVATNPNKIDTTKPSAPVVNKRKQI